MSHLGERLTALVDGELGHRERERALAHLTLCAPCRAEADQIRAVRDRLRQAFTAGPNPSGDLLARLYALSETAPPAVSNPISRPPLQPIRISRRPADNRPQGRAGSRRRVGYLIAGAATMAVVSMGGASFAAGGQTTRPPRVRPSIEQYSIEHDFTSGNLPTDATGTPQPTPSTLRPAYATGAARP